MLVHKLGHYPTRFHRNGEIHPYTGPEPSLLCKSACMRGGHMQAPIPTLHHTHTHMSGTHASFQMIPTFSWTSSGEPLMIYGPRIVNPRRHSSAGVARHSSLLFCVLLGHAMM